MQITKEINNESCTFTLSEKASIYDATALHHDLLAAFETSSSVTIDWGQVTSCDSAIIQLLISAAKSAAVKHIDYKITEPSPSVAGFFDHLGFNWQDIVQH